MVQKLHRAGPFPSSADKMVTLMEIELQLVARFKHRASYVKTLEQRDYIYIYGQHIYVYV